MPLVPIALANRSNPARYTQGGTARLENCYVETIGEDGKTPWAVYAIDGMQGFANLTGAAGSVRASIEVNGIAYFVAGLTLYSVNSVGTVTNLGSMSVSATGPVYMARNRRATPDIAIVCDGVMYRYRTSLAQVTDVDLLSPQSLAFGDGYFIIGTADNTWQIGAIDDADAWDALDYERADSNPDSVVRVYYLQRDAVIMGEVSTEFWRHTGAADFPYERTATMDMGCLAPASVQTVEQTMCWIAHDRTVRMLEGYQGRRISTHAVERDIEALTSYENISSATWTRDGHTFYAITSDSWTWVYDTITGLWHTRKSDGRANWRAVAAVEFGDKVLVGDRDSENVYEMGRDFLDEAGAPIKMVLTLPPVHAYPAPLTCHALYIDVEKGVGTGTGNAEDVDPEIIVRVSKDGGATFGPQRALTIGQQGKRTATVKSFRFGQSTADGFVFQLEMPTRTVRAVYQMMADMEKSAA